MDSGIKMPTIISAGVDDCPCFSTLIAMIPIDCKITNSPYTCFFCNNYNIGELTSTTSKERMTMGIIFVGATPIKVHIPVSFVFRYICSVTQCYTGRQRKA